MSQQANNHEFHDPEEALLIDRLVDGELAGAARRELLLRLDAEPDGWRRCALAFLESQSLGEALKAPSSAATVRLASVEGKRRQAEPHTWRRTANYAGLAAGLAAAFFVGWATRGMPEPVQVAKNVASTSTVPLSTEAPLLETDEPAFAIAKSNEPTESNPLPAPLVERWEKQGYETETHERLISVRLGDGRKVELPVQEVRLRYVANRTY